MGCNAPADCTDLPEDDECQTRTCVEHACGQEFTASGTALALQTPRDCEELQCDGAGGVMSAPHDTDLPNDLNDCTDDTCSAGTPTHTMRGMGSECGDGTLSCDASGQCVGCSTPDECGDDTFCAANTCTSGVCGRTFATLGSVAPTELQEPGDCQALICDGEGGLAPIVEDTDLPQDDGDECTTQACVDGAPMFPPALIDTPCASGGSYCDGSGSCVGCNTGSHCGTDTACAVRVRDERVRRGGGPVGTAIPSGSQVAGDCQLLTCGGGTQSSADNTDRARGRQRLHRRRVHGGCAQQPARERRRHVRASGFTDVRRQRELPELLRGHGLHRRHLLRAHRVHLGELRGDPADGGQPTPE
ncbi:MAG: hypothetical protein IPG81_01560 [Sandaracinaceae bacterium]|nr:hypothetical protein [Sandaracinaceae bacterium]